MPSALLVAAVVLVSRATGVAGAPASDISFPFSSISADGRFVAFASPADNLSDADDDAADSNVYVRDLEAHTTTFVSTGVRPSISADGRFVAFDSADQVFVRDREANTTTLVSRASGPAGAAGDGASDTASISADGRRVAFISAANNLSDDDTDAFQNIYVRDLDTSATTYVSRAADGAPADRISGEPAISADGRFVAFASDARNLSDDDNDNVRDVFVRDLQANAVAFVSRASDGTAGNGPSSAPAISADGRYVAFQSVADNLSAEDADGSPSIFVRDLQTGTTTYASGTIHGGALDPSISADGRRVAFEQEVNSPLGEIEPGENIFVRDLRADTTTFVGRVSPDPGETTANGLSYAPVISGDGHHVAFASEANGVSSEDNDSVQNVFARDLRETAPAPPVPAPAADTTAPRISRLRMTRRRFAVGGRGTAFVFRLSEDARTTITITRRRRTVMVVRARTRAGVNRIAFTRTLRPGRYRATVRATDAAGNRSAPRRVTFRVVRR